MNQLKAKVLKFNVSAINLVNQIENKQHSLLGQVRRLHKNRKKIILFTIVQDNIEFLRRNQNFGDEIINFTLRKKTVKNSQFDNML